LIKKNKSDEFYINQVKELKILLRMLKREGYDLSSDKEVGIKIYKDAFIHNIVVYFRKNPEKKECSVVQIQDLGNLNYVTRVGHGNFLEAYMTDHMENSQKYINKLYAEFKKQKNEIQSNIILMEDTEKNKDLNIKINQQKIK